MTKVTLIGAIVLLLLGQLGPAWSQARWDDQKGCWVRVDMPWKCQKGR